MELVRKINNTGFGPGGTFLLPDGNVDFEQPLH